MNLFEKILREGLSQIENNHLNSGNFDELTSKMSSDLDQIEDEKIKSVGKASLDELINQKDNILKLKKDGLALFMTHVAGGREHEAEMEFIRTTQSADDLIAGMYEDAQKVAQQKKAEEEFKAEVISLIKSIGQAGAQVLLPLLLAAL